MSPTGSPKHSTVSPVASPAAAQGGDQRSAVCGPSSRSGRVVSPTSRGPVHASMSAASSQAGRVPAIGCIVATHSTGPSSPALCVATRVLSDQGLTAPLAGGGSRLVRHTTRPEQRGKEDTMNRLFVIWNEACSSSSRSSVLPTGGHGFSPLVAIGSPQRAAGAEPEAEGRGWRCAGHGR